MSLILQAARRCARRGTVLRQCGIIAGKAEHIEKLRKHPLYRALRVDKIAYSALEATLEAYRKGSAADEVPVLRMMAMTKEMVRERAERFIESIGTSRENSANSGSEPSNLKFEIEDGVSAIGGGAGPNVVLQTALIAVSHDHLSASRIELALRNARTPVVTRIVDDRVMIDLRTVGQDEEEELKVILLGV